MANFTRNQGEMRWEQSVIPAYAFTRTRMYWRINHMVVPKEAALQCDDCHSESGRLDWKALGYPGDPIDTGPRTLQDR